MAQSAAPAGKRLTPKKTTRFGMMAAKSGLCYVVYANRVKLGLAPAAFHGLLAPASGYTRRLTFASQPRPACPFTPVSQPELE